MQHKKSVIVGAAVAAVTLGGISSAGLVQAATSTSTTDKTSIVDKIATKFNLNKDEVKAVFDEERSARQAEHKAKQAERLATAVKDGTLTQAQADYITKAQAEIATLRDAATPDKQTDAQREQIKTKMDALRTWATDNKVDAKYLGGGMHGGPGGPKGDRPDMAPPTDAN